MSLRRCVCALPSPLIESLPRQVLSLIHSQDGLFGTGPAKQPEGLPDELRRLAQRIRTFTEGSFPPSPPPALVDKFTDALLVTALDVVTAVAAEEQQLSSNAAVRLLAWTLADARGAVVPLDKPLALTVGKRLHRQAQSVRAVLAAARDEATHVGAW